VIYITACLERINNSSGMGCLYENAIPSLTQHEGGHGGVVTTHADGKFLYKDKLLPVHILTVIFVQLSESLEKKFPMTL
jgi:hypothetical protein